MDRAARNHVGHSGRHHPRRLVTPLLAAADDAGRAGQLTLSPRTRLAASVTVVVARWTHSATRCRSLTALAAPRPLSWGLACGQVSTRPRVRLTRGPFQVERAAAGEVKRLGTSRPSATPRLSSATAMVMTDEVRPDRITEFPWDQRLRLLLGARDCRS
jgi:hypothetical protein